MILAVARVWTTSQQRRSSPPTRIAEPAGLRRLPGWPLGNCIWRLRAEPLRLALGRCPSPTGACAVQRCVGALEDRSGNVAVAEARERRPGHLGSSATTECNSETL